ncbi:tumor protein p53-inducible nuclear protein 2 [Pempheris klunzingeri]|uniref:tumor protein p53-inducible nuclear protein 2 n=1 Tax=Pempheris klunzingeri TaxID=3127111 RepID=UPI00397F74F0
MFKTITRLLFGGEEETPEDVKSGEVVEEGWLVVSHQEARSAEGLGAEPTDSQTPNSALHYDAAANMETDVSVSNDPDPTVHSSSSSSSSNTGQAIAAAASQPKALVELNQRAKTWADRHHVTRNAIQRQNRVRQGVQHHSFHLQQPGHRNLCH